MLFSEEKLFIILSLRDMEYESNRGSGPTEPQCCFLVYTLMDSFFPKGHTFIVGKHDRCYSLSVLFLYCILPLC